MTMKTNTTKKMKLHPAKRLLACCLALVLGVATMAMLSGCGASEMDEQDVRAGVTRELDLFENPTDEGVCILFGFDPSNEEDVKPFERHKRYLRDCTYTIDDIRYEGKTAIVTITMKRIDIDAAYERADDRFKEWVSTPEAEEMHEGFKQKASDVFETYYLEELEAETNMVERTGELVMVTSGHHEWHADPDSMGEFCKNFWE